MAFKNWQNINNPVEDELADFLFENLTTEILVDLIKQKIMSGETNVSEVMQELMDDKEAAVIIMKKNND
ncbi:MAG: hypothetical protein WBZ29_17590 [Methanocella sp.]